MIWGEVSGDTEINHLDNKLIMILAKLIDQQVLRLDVSVDYLALVTMSNG